MLGIVKGMSPQKPDGQPSSCACEDHFSDDESGDFKTRGRRAASGLKEGVNGVGGHWKKVQDSGDTSKGDD